MDRRIGTGRTKHVSEFLLDIAVFQLHVNVGLSGDKIENFVEARQQWCGSMEGVEVGSAYGQRNLGRNYRLIVMNYANTIGSYVNIELYRLEPQVKRALEGVQRVFRENIVDAAVRDVLCHGRAAAAPPVKPRTKRS